jgi:hypothetical protein
VGQASLPVPLFFQILHHHQFVAAVVDYLDGNNDPHPGAPALALSLMRGRGIGIGEGGGKRGVETAESESSKRKALRPRRLKPVPLQESGRGGQEGSQFLRRNVRERKASHFDFPRISQDRPLNTAENDSHGGLRGGQ